MISLTKYEGQNQEQTVSLALSICNQIDFPALLRRTYSHAESHLLKDCVTLGLCAETVS